MSLNKFFKVMLITSMLALGIESNESDHDLTECVYNEHFQVLKAEIKIQNFRLTVYLKRKMNAKLGKKKL